MSGLLTESCATGERGLRGSCGMQMRGEGGGEDIGSAFCTTIKDVLPVALALPLSGSPSVSRCELRAPSPVCVRGDQLEGIPISATGFFPSVVVFSAEGTVLFHASECASSVPLCVCVCVCLVLIWAAQRL